MIFFLLLGVLYALEKETVNVERFTEKGKDSKDGAAANSSLAKLMNVSDDISKIFQPGFEHVIAAFKGEAKVDGEKKYDDKGDEIKDTAPPKDEVSIKDPKLRLANSVLRDLQKYDPGFYFSLAALALGKPVSEEYVI